MTSPCGAFDMGANVFQWNEVVTRESFRGWRGGSFASNLAGLLSSTRGLGDPSHGLRVASNVPEPSTGVLAVIACGMMWWWRKRFK
ncbi:MAG: PEP-CTERM sorting domain-containing protein [Planctomycetia bacterium]|nr:PEP-CTERM sorting domain-containing protein [Planctomycetia bacterium]